MPYKKETTTVRIHYKPLPASEDRVVTKTTITKTRSESLKDTCLEVIAKAIRRDAGFFAKQNKELPNELLGELNEEVKAQEEYNQQNP